jgi:hypothetical protein
MPAWENLGASLAFKRLDLAIPAIRSNSMGSLLRFERTKRNTHAACPAASGGGVRPLDHE